MDFFSFALLFGAGLLGGLLGTVGGGVAVVFPALLFTGVPALAAMGTYKIGFAVFDLAMAGYFLRKDKVDFGLLWPVVFATLAGSVFGSFLALSIGEALLKNAAAFFMLSVAVFLFFKPDFGVKGQRLEKRVLRRKMILALPASAALGAYGGFFGAGVGIFRTFVFAFLGLGFVQAIANKAVLGFFAATTSASIFVLAGQYDLQSVFPVALGLGVGGLAGAKAFLKLGDDFARKFLIAFCVVFSMAIFAGAL